MPGPRVSIALFRATRPQTLQSLPLHVPEWIAITIPGSVVERLMGLGGQGERVVPA